MPTNEERRDVAKNLREWKCKGWRIDVLPSKVCYDLWCELESLLKTEDSDRYEETFERLADLIEPEPCPSGSYDIVRCHDCTYYESYVDLCELFGSAIPSMEEKNGDGFCAWGRRKDVNE